MSSFLKYKLALWLGLFLYSLNSYLILLRDGFILERLSLTLANPGIETTGISLAKLLRVNHLTILIFFLVISLVGYGFLGLLRHTKPKSKVNWKYLVLLIATVFISFPSLSTDVFDYTNANRVTFLHQADPWVYPADNFGDDQEIWYGSWTDRGSVYPPLNFVSNVLVYLLFGYEIIPSVIGFKLLATLLFGLIIFILHVLASVSANRLYSVAANPLLLIEFVGNAHNDLLMGLFLLLAVLALNMDKSIQAGILFGLAILSKISVVLLVPIAGLHLLLQKEFKKLLSFSVVCGVISLIGFLSLGSSLPFLIDNILDQMSIYQKSLASALRLLGLHLFGSDQIGWANNFQRLITLPVFSILSLWAFFSYRQKSLNDAFVATMMLYLIIQSAMFQPWYLAWFMVLLPLVQSARLLRVGLVFCLTALISYPVYYLSLFYYPLSAWWQLILALTVILLPVMIWIGYPKRLQKLVDKSIVIN